jgi:opacity protein-like surface antigen
LRQKKIKAHEYKNWTFNVGGGADLGRGTTKTFVRGGGGLAGVGVARNYSKYFGFRFDFQWVNLPLRASALQQGQAPSGSNYVYAFTLDPIISVPVTKEYTAYFLIGPSYNHRAGKLDSSTAVPGSPCNSFYDWWGSCYINSLPINGKFLSESQNEFGFNFGGGLAKKVSRKVEVYGEFRQQHSSHDKITTDWRSVTIGLRW